MHRVQDLRDLLCSRAFQKREPVWRLAGEADAQTQALCGMGVTGCKRADPLRHCEDAPCMHACISGAISRNKEGVVLTDTDKCIGCWTCVMVCPYGVIGRHLETHKSYRCDRCPDRETPACVSSCPTKALVYRTVKSFSKEVRKEAASKMLAE